MFDEGNRSESSVGGLVEVVVRCTIVEVDSGLAVDEREDSSESCELASLSRMKDSEKTTSY